MPTAPQQAPRQKKTLRRKKHKNKTLQATLSSHQQHAWQQKTLCWWPHHRRTGQLRFTTKQQHGCKRGGDQKSSMHNLMVRQSHDKIKMVQVGSANSMLMCTNAYGCECRTLHGSCNCQNIKSNVSCANCNQNEMQLPMAWNRHRHYEQQWNNSHVTMLMFNFIIHNRQGGNDHL